MVTSEEERLRGLAMRMLGYTHMEDVESDMQGLGSLVSDTIRVSWNREGVEHKWAHADRELPLQWPAVHAEDLNWIIRGRQLVQEFFQQSGSAVLQAGIWKRVEHDQEKWEIDEDKKLITVPVKAEMEWSAFKQILYHGTRPDLALLILRDGLRSSQCSHGVIGAWTCESAEYPLEWGVTPWDKFPGCFITLGIPPDQEIRKNRRIGAGRAVVTAASALEIVGAEILCLTFRIPSIEWSRVQSALRDMIRSIVVREVGSVVGKPGQKEYVKQILGLCSSRFSCYAIATDLLWNGAPQPKYREGALELSLLLLQVLRPFFGEQSEKKLEMECNWLAFSAAGAAEVLDRHYW